MSSALETAVKKTEIKKFRAFQDAFDRQGNLVTIRIVHNQDAITEGVIWSGPNKGERVNNCLVCGSPVCNPLLHSP